MDSHLWRDRQQQSEHQPPALALLAPEPSSSIDKAAVASQTPLFTLPSASYFTLAQWQELELQALIYKYMLAGVSVPVELILPVRRSLLSASPYFHYPELYHHFQPSLLQTSYWGKCGIDPEPGRCRRTDGKKWRCSREVVVGQKYCERHVHRGRNRSRKHVEAPTPSSICLKTGLFSPSVLLDQENHLNLPRPLATPNTHSPNQRQSGITTVEKNLQGNCSNFYLDDLPDNKPEGYVLQRFLDEWPKSQCENGDSVNYAIHPASTTHLSISVPGNHSSDFSLKLSTGNPEKPRESNNNGLEMQQLPQPSNKGSGWVSHAEATMGGPLAEALRSSTSTHSPTSVLHKPNGSIYEISSISP
ncbi:growth-regulating factor 3-like [Curcuma longa]|uniref:growth-regulating factor 3-like n=1 Tax=Curcuma longa TaxID=136217 RepID=UPI003D9F5D92